MQLDSITLTDVFLWGWKFLVCSAVDQNLVETREITIQNIFSINFWAWNQLRTILGCLGNVYTNPRSLYRKIVRDIQISRNWSRNLQPHLLNAGENVLGLLFGCPCHRFFALKLMIFSDLEQFQPSKQVESSRNQPLWTCWSKNGPWAKCSSP